METKCSLCESTQDKTQKMSHIREEADFLENTRLYNAEKRGRAEGRTEGITQGRAELLKEMIADGIPEEVIKKYMKKI